MQIYRYPKKSVWPDILRRPAADVVSVERSVWEILEAVRTEGDAAVRKFTKWFDKVTLNEFAVDGADLDAAGEGVAPELKDAINTAHSNISLFHRSQREEPHSVEPLAGVECWRKSVAIEKVGLYVPGGSAPLFSTVLMLAIPAKLAGCGEIILCTPPDEHGSVDPAILYTAQLCGVTKVFRIGGAQAIAAMAFGTESIPKVYKLFGPGNAYVTRAKQMVSMNVAIDMAAGPSEVAVLADETAEPSFVAADLLSQAEHGPDSHVILVTTDEMMIERTLIEIDRQVAELPRREIGKAALENSRVILVEDIDDGMELINEYAPEHLILALADADQVAEQVVNAGSVFIGNYSCESAGDYASGTNHTLPTAGFAKSFSGVSLDSFVKKITFQRLTAEGIRNLGPVVELMAAAEGLDAHKNAISVRLEEINAI